MAEEKLTDNSKVISSLIINILVSGLFILLLIVTSNYQSPAFWVGAGGELLLVYLTIRLSRRWGILRYLFVAIALLLPSALDTALSISHELRPNLAFGIYLLVIIWLPLIRQAREARMLTQGNKTPSFK